MFANMNSHLIEISIRIRIILILQYQKYLMIQRSIREKNVLIAIDVFMLLIYPPGEFVIINIHPGWIVSLVQNPRRFM